MIQFKLQDRKPPNAILSCRILQNRPIAKNQWMIWLKPENQSLPSFELGNFCMLSMPELIDPLLPRPFAIAEEKDGAWGFIYRVTGKHTHILAGLQAGTRIDMLGPFGKGISRDVFKSGKHLFIAGGVGYASLLPMIESVGGSASMEVFYGVRDELEVIRKGKFHIEFASDDGSIGHRGRLPDLLKNKNFSQTTIYVCGPSGMMRALYSILPPEQTFYFLEETMGCGFGICVGCVVPVDSAQGKITNAKSCLEGPMFLGSQLKTWSTQKGGH